jgi:nucleotide-binding universal stress UspA family protein
VGGREPARSWPGAAILVPVDLRAQSARDVQDAEQIARAFGTDMVLVHAVSLLQAPPWFRGDLSAHQLVQSTAARRRLESLASKVSPGVNTEVRVVAGRPAAAIAALAVEERIGVVVMHLRRGPGLLGARAGSIATQVLRHAATPVLALPGRAVKRVVGARMSARKRARSSR